LTLTKSISPASFFLPGLFIKNDPPQIQPDDALPAPEEPCQLVAQF
jgi:hypothetical protein